MSNSRKRFNFYLGGDKDVDVPRSTQNDWDNKGGSGDDSSSVDDMQVIDTYTLTTVFSLSIYRTFVNLVNRHFIEYDCVSFRLNFETCMENIKFHITSYSTSHTKLRF